MSLMSLTAVELGKKIKAGEVTVKEAVEAAFAQIEKVEGDVHSFVTLTKEQALKDAGEIHLNERFNGKVAADIFDAVKKDVEAGVMQEYNLQRIDRKSVV